MCVWALSTSHYAITLFCGILCTTAIDVKMEINVILFLSNMILHSPNELTLFACFWEKSTHVPCTHHKHTHPTEEVSFATLWCGAACVPVLMPVQNAKSVWWRQISNGTARSVRTKSKPIESLSICWTMCPFYSMRKAIIFDNNRFSSSYWSLMTIYWLDRMRNVCKMWTPLKAWKTSSYCVAIDLHEGFDGVRMETILRWRCWKKTNVIRYVCDCFRRFTFMQNRDSDTLECAPSPADSCKFQYNTITQCWRFFSSLAVTDRNTLMLCDLIARSSDGVCHRTPKFYVKCAAREYFPTARHEHSIPLLSMQIP